MSPEVFAVFLVLIDLWLILSRLVQDKLKKKQHLKM